MGEAASPALAGGNTGAQPGGLIGWCRRIAANGIFQNFILAVIVANAVLVGVETNEQLVSQYNDLLNWINAAIQIIFIFEITVRLLAYWPRLGAFFRDPWNVFDFLIVAFSMLPLDGRFATVARLARLMRVTRLISFFPQLRLIVSTMLRSVGSMVHVITLTALVLYVYAIIGYHLFSEHDPEHWGSLGVAALTLFQILTLEGWVEVQAISLEVSPLAWIYYGSYILIAVFVVINLFIAVVLNNLESVKEEEKEAATAASPDHDVLQRIEEMKQNLEALESSIRKQSSS